MMSSKYLSYSILMDNHWLTIFFCAAAATYFFFSSDYIFSLVCLLFFTFLSSLLMYMKTHEFWGLSLMLIVMVTGLFLVFAYIVSVNPQEPSSPSKWKFSFDSSMILSFIFILLWNLDDFNPSLNSGLWSPLEEGYTILYSSSFFVSLHLIIMILFLVIFFMRFTYSKGGSLRKKF